MLNLSRQPILGTGMAVLRLGISTWDIGDTVPNNECCGNKPDFSVYAYVFSPLCVVVWPKLRIGNGTATDL